MFFFWYHNLVPVLGIVTPSETLLKKKKSNPIFNVKWRKIYISVFGNKT